MASTPQELGREFEARFARRHGLSAQPGSGSTPRFKLDVDGRSFLVSLKHTTRESFSIKASDLREAFAGARGPGSRDQVPAVAFELDGFPETVWMLSESDLMDVARGDLKLNLRPSKSELRRAAAEPSVLREER